MASSSTAHTPESQVVRFDSSATGSQPRQNGSCWPTRRHTPYTKTPKSRKLNNKKGRLERTPVLASDAGGVDLHNLVNKTWHVYQVTPLSEFKQDAANLKKYSRHLSAFLQAESQKGIGVDVENEIGDRAVFSLLKGLTSSPDDSEAVELTVKVKSQGNSTSVNNRVTLHAILCSVDADINSNVTLDHSLLSLPVLIMKGTVAVSSCVIRWLESQFDCRIRRMTFNPMSLAWIVSMWAGVTTEYGDKPVELQYTVPHDIEGLSRITLTIEQQDAQNLWQSIHDDASGDEFTGEEVAAFIKSLEAHFFHHFKIHLAGMPLTTVGTPLAYVGHQGKLKILQEEGIIPVLQHMTQLATEDIHTH